MGKHAGQEFRQFLILSHIHTCTYVHTDTQTYPQKETKTYIHKYIHTYTHIYTHTQTDSHTQRHTDTHIYTYTHTHTFTGIIHIIKWIFLLYIGLFVYMSVCVFQHIFTKKLENGKFILMACQIAMTTPQIQVLLISILWDTWLSSVTSTNSIGQNCSRLIVNVLNKHFK